MISEFGRDHLMQMLSHFLEVFLGIFKAIKVLQSILLNKDDHKDNLELNLSHVEYKNGVKKLREKILLDRPDVIVPLSGCQPNIIAGKMLESNMLPIPIQPCVRTIKSIESKEYAGYTSCGSDTLETSGVNIYIQNDLLLLPRDTKILLIDDFAFRSASAYAVKSFLKQHGFSNIKYGVLVLLDAYSDDLKLIEVDFYGIEAKQLKVNFPK